MLARNAVTSHGSVVNPQVPAWAITVSGSSTVDMCNAVPSYKPDPVLLKVSSPGGLV
ncbi:hypothetical protein [Streptomyces sp. NPDC086766]|uniref:hypothetical protein n=1 Tax=Streptomyces sp. NPDC086766 TaxID=3365754 RepID=UPI003803CACD